MEYHLGQQITRIGREPSNDIVLSGDARVSRYHAEIVRDGSGFVIRDLGSRNGTLVNGSRISRHRLKNGDEIQVGYTRMTFSNGVLLVPVGAVAPLHERGRPARDVVPVPEQWSNAPIIAIVSVAILAVAAIVALMLRSPSATSDAATNMAKQWVAQQVDTIAAETVRALAVAQIPLPPEPLYNKVHKQVADTKNWVFTSPEKVAENVYRVQATANFGIPLTGANYSVTSRYTLTVNLDTGTITADGPQVQVSES